MAYLGRALTSGNYLKLDDISSQFNGSTKTFSLTSGGNLFYPGSAFSIQVVLGGVIQEPESAYTINQNQITFASAPGSGDDFFCVVLGTALGIGVPGEGTVSGSKLTEPFDYNSGLLYLDSANNRIGVNSTTPTVALDIVGNVKVSGTITAALAGTATSTTNIPNLTGAITSVNTVTSLGSFSSANLATALTDETGSGANVFATSPTLVTPTLGAASATSIVVSGVSTVSAGSTSAPSITPSGDSNTGIFFPAADTISASTSGTARITIDSSGNITVTNNLIIPLGTAALPSLAFLSDPNTGLFSPGADQLAISTNGTERLRLSSTGEFMFKGAGTTAGTDKAVSFNGSAPVNSLVIDSSGNFGIGSASPSTFGKLTVLDGSINIVSNTISKRLSFWSTSNTNSENAYIQSQNDGATTNTGHIIFATKNTATVLAERVRITAEGLIGIGSTGPQEIVEVRKDSAGASVVGVLLTNASSNANTAIGISFSPNIGGFTRTASIYGVNSSGGIGNGTDLAFHTNLNGASGTEKARIDSSGRLLVGTTSAVAGSVTTTAIVGSQLTKSTGFRTVSGSGTLDLDLSEGTGISGHLYVSSTRQSNALVKRNTIFFISTRQGSNTAITSLNSNDGLTAGSAFTITNPSANIFRFTDTAAGGNVTVSLCFVGTMTD